MKILIVSQYFWPENFRINDIALGLKERGHEVSVFTGLPNYPRGSFFPNYSIFGPYSEDHDGIKIYRTPLIPRGRGKGVMLFLNYLTFAILGSFFILFLYRKKFDRIFVNQLSPVSAGLPAIFLKKITGIPVYFWVLDLWPESFIASVKKCPKFLSFTLKTLVKFIYKNCDKILVTSKGFITKIQDMGVSLEKIEYWPQWGETLFLKKSTEAQFPAEFHQWPFKIVFAGNIGHAQSFETIIQAADLLKIYPNIHWVIFGDGNMKDWVSKEIAKRDLTHNVHLMGSYPIESMPSAFKYADALLVTLKKDELFSITVPGKIQAYLASEKIVIGSLDGDGADVLCESGGLSSPAENPIELAKSVERVFLMSESERIKRCTESKEYFLKNFEREDLLSRLENHMK